MTRAGFPPTTAHGGTSFTGQLATDGTFTNVQRSVSGYLYSAGTGFVGVYTQYSGGSYSGLIAQYPIPATSRAEIVTASASASGNDIDVDVEIGIKSTTPGGIDEVWSQDSFTLSNALEEKTVTLSSSADQVIVPTTSGCVGLSSVTVPMVSLKAETFSANGTYSVPAGYDGYGTVEVSVGSQSERIANSVTIAPIYDSGGQHVVGNRVIIAYNRGNNSQFDTTRSVITSTTTWSA